MLSKEKVRRVFEGLKPDSIPVFDMCETGVCAPCSSDIDLLDFENNARFPGEDKFNMLALSDPFQMLQNIYGLETVLYEIGENPNSFGDKLKKAEENLYAGAEKTLPIHKKNIDGVWLWADMAYAKGAFFSREFYRKYLLEIHRDIVNFFDRYDLPVVLHSDGNINEIFPDLVNAGFKGFHPLESRSGMEISALKKISNKAVFFANFSPDLLRTAGLDELKDAARQKIESAGDSGYIFGLESPIAADIDAEKYMELVSYIRDYTSI